MPTREESEARRSIAHLSPVYAGVTTDDTGCGLSLGRRRERLWVRSPSQELSTEGREGLALSEGSGEDWAGTPRGRDPSACRPARLCRRGESCQWPGGLTMGWKGASGERPELLFRNFNFTATDGSEGGRQRGRDHSGSGAAQHPACHRGGAGGRARRKRGVPELPLAGWNQASCFAAWGAATVW